MQTNRFETFFDAIIAIIMTILILKISQPSEPTLNAIWSSRISYMAYLISFLTLFNVWYSNHNLFHKVDELNNRVVAIYGILIFILSLNPYFTTWVALNVESVPAETTYGMLFIILNILYILSIKALHHSNPYNKELQEHNSSLIRQMSPLIAIFIGFILTYTIFKPGIYYCCLIAIIWWIAIDWRKENEN